MSSDVLNRMAGLENKLDELVAVVSGLCRQVAGVSTPDETVGPEQAAALSGLTQSKVRHLVSVGVLSDARPPGQRRNGVPRRWYVSELVAYRDGGELAVNSVKRERGRGA